MKIPYLLLFTVYPEGYEPLREQVKIWLKEKENIKSEDDVVIITSGGTQVMDITTRVLALERAILLFVRIRRSSALLMRSVPTAASLSVFLLMKTE